MRPARSPTNNMAVGGRRPIQPAEKAASPASRLKPVSAAGDWFAVLHGNCELTYMNLRVANTFVIALATVVFGQFPNAARPQFESVKDADAYAVYAAVVPTVWATKSKDALLLQQETEGIEAMSTCLSSSSAVTAEPDWNVVEMNFKQANAKTRVLERALPVDIPYRLIPRADILADDARLALKYPGTWQRRPESMEYAAVSAVGFNPTKNKAIVYVRLRSRGNIHNLELRDGKWAVARRSRGCGGWVA
jgi:hypothetical protein